MAVVRSEKIKDIEAAYKRPIAAILTDMVHQKTYADVCAQLQISRRTLLYWMERHGIQGPGRGARSKTSDVKAKVSAALTGIPRSEDVRIKISESLSGRTLSSDTKKKISASLKKRHREQRGD